jgi:hypothetical protein
MRQIAASGRSPRATSAWASFKIVRTQTDLRLTRSHEVVQIVARRYPLNMPVSMARHRARCNARLPRETSVSPVPTALVAATAPRPAACDAPRVVLMSDAEMFPAAFRSLGLGKVVGAPMTMGAKIGTGSHSLLGGSALRTTRAARGSRRAGRTLENFGIPPDVYHQITRWPIRRRA